MVAVHQGTASSTGNPILLFITAVQEELEGSPMPAGFLVDPEALDYRVLDPSGTEVVPPTAVDLVAHRVRLGTFAPPITVGAGAALGQWTIEWTWDLELQDGFHTYVQTTHFLVVDSLVPLLDSYVQIAEARAEGVLSTFTDARLGKALEEASRRVERYTRRFFDARYRAYSYDGKGRGVLLRVRMPIVAIEEVEATFSDFRPSIRLIEQNDLRVYNRHIRASPMLDPDDRESPRLEVLRSSDFLDRDSLYDPIARRFVDSQQNVLVTGWWGYTDPDGGPFGTTPFDIQRVTMMLAFRGIRPLWGSFSGAVTTGAIQSERTRDQSVTYATGSSSSGSSASTRAPITGDPTIDNILLAYMSPPVMEAV